MYSVDLVQLLTTKVIYVSFSKEMLSNFVIMDKISLQSVFSWFSPGHLTRTCYVFMTQKNDLQMLYILTLT